MDCSLDGRVKDCSLHMSGDVGGDQSAGRQFCHRADRYIPLPLQSLLSNIITDPVNQSIHAISASRWDMEQHIGRARNCRWRRAFWTGRTVHVRSTVIRHLIDPLYRIARTLRPLAMDIVRRMSTFRSHPNAAATAVLGSRG
jgi:hypothetical protein